MVHKMVGSKVSKEYPDGEMVYGKAMNDSLMNDIWRMHKTQNKFNRINKELIKVVWMYATKIWYMILRKGEFGSVLKGNQRMIETDFYQG